MNLNAFIPTTDTVPATAFRPAFSVIVAVVMLVASSVLSATPSIEVNASTKTAVEPLAGEIDSIVGAEQDVFAKSSVAAVLMTPLGHVIVTVIGGWLVVPPPPPHADNINEVNIIENALLIIVLNVRGI